MKPWRVRLRIWAHHSMLGRAMSLLRFARWEFAGHAGPPPPLRKQYLVRDYGAAFGAQVLVETGTYFGDMVAAAQSDFREVTTIELAPVLAEAAARRFGGVPGIRVLPGDSREVLPRVLAQLHERAVFWLDGHFSGGVTAAGDTPLLDEVTAVLQHHVADHVVLIDDARCLGTGDYPSRDDLRAVLEQHRPDWVFEERDDVVRIHPRPSAQRPPDRLGSFPTQRS